MVEEGERKHWCQTRTGLVLGPLLVLAVFCCLDSSGHLAVSRGKPLGARRQRLAQGEAPSHSWERKAQRGCSHCPVLELGTRSVQLIRRALEGLNAEDLYLFGCIALEFTECEDEN